MHSNTLSTGRNGLQVPCKQAAWLSVCLYRRVHCDMSPWSHWTATGHLIKEPHEGTINWNQTWMQILHDNTCNPEVLLHPILHVYNWYKPPVFVDKMSNQLLISDHQLLPQITSLIGSYWPIQLLVMDIIGNYLNILLIWTTHENTLVHQTC